MNAFDDEQNGRIVSEVFTSRVRHFIFQCVCEWVWVSVRVHLAHWKTQRGERGDTDSPIHCVFSRWDESMCTIYTQMAGSRDHWWEWERRERHFQVVSMNSEAITVHTVLKWEREIRSSLLAWIHWGERRGERERELFYTNETHSYIVKISLYEWKC